MIVTTDDQWTAVYAAIREESRRSEEKHVFIYASAADVDAVCTLRILERLLQNDLIPHGWLAVSRYDDVIADFTRHYRAGDEATRTVIMVNCGAAEDMHALLELGQRPGVRVVVLDCHRPIVHYANADDAADAVIVFLDEKEGTAKADIPPAGNRDDDDASDLDGDDDLDAAGGSDGENAPDNGADGPPARRRRLDAAGGDDRAAGGGAAPPSRRERRAARADALEARRAYYARGAHHGKPSALVAFDLAYALGRETSHMAWLALVGLTDAAVHGRVPPEKYDEYRAVMETWLANAGHADGGGADGGGGGAAAAGAAVGRIAPREDFRFGLLWDWNLFEAMAYSPYVAARLQTYTAAGLARLTTLLAKMAVPLAQAQALYSQDLRPEYRDSLPARLRAKGEAFRLGDALFRSFQLQDGAARCVTAVDAALAAAALLGAGGRGGGGGAPPAGAPPAAAPDPGDAADRFWDAYAALSPGDDRGQLRRGLGLAKAVARALVREGGAVVGQRLWHSFKAFRLFDLSDHRPRDAGLLAHPLALRRLADFLADDLFHRTGKRKPAVLIAPRDAATGRCLVVGAGAGGRAPGRGSRLGVAFQQAADAVGAAAWADLFDAGVVEVAHADVERFKGELMRLATTSDLLG